MNGTATAYIWEKVIEPLETAKVKRIRQALETLAEITEIAEAFPTFFALRDAVSQEHERRVGGRRRHVKELEENPDFF